MGILDNPMHVKVRCALATVRGKHTACECKGRWPLGPRTPIKDFINFKEMSSNEILLNLENHKNFASSELVGGLVELSTRE